MNKQAEFKTDLNQRYWKYQRSHFPDEQRYFERPYGTYGRPPVFTRAESWRNVIVNPKANQSEINNLLTLIPDGERHKWFRSMNSSQALAQSVLGNLAIHDLMPCLSELKCEEGLNLFGDAQISAENFTMEFKVDYLGEPRRTSLDGHIAGEYQIAVECKFTETEVGSCSRPRLKKSASNHHRDHCDGTYSIQRERKERCSLTESGIRYWRYIPHLFKWESHSDINSCPLNKNYQLVRNVLAVGVKPDGRVSLGNGHVVLIYDERNPSFQKNGDGWIAYTEVQEALREPAMLRKCSWQYIVEYLRDNDILGWLTENLALKYGL